MSLARTRFRALGATEAVEYASLVSAAEGVWVPPSALAAAVASGSSGGGGGGDGGDGGGGGFVLEEAYVFGFFLGGVGVTVFLLPAGVAPLPLLPRCLLRALRQRRVRREQPVVGVGVGCGGAAAAPAAIVLPRSTRKTLLALYRPWGKPLGR